MAAMGATMDMTMRAMGFRSPSRPPAKMAPHRATVASMPTAPAMVAAMVPVSMWRCWMWANSWAMTPSSSRGGRARRIPAVTQTTAFLGLRPVAKAFGCSDGATATTGMGSPARCRSRSTIP